MSEVGERIREIRTAKGLSQAALARSAAISNDYMFKIEAGKVTNIGLEVISAIADALEVHPTVILYGTNIPQTTFLNGTYIDPNNPLDVTQLVRKVEEMFPLSKDEKELLSFYREIDEPKQKKMVKEMAKTLAGK